MSRRVAYIALEGAAQFRRRLQPQTLLAYAWRRALIQAADVVEDSARARSPLGATRTLHDSITHVLDPSPIPMFAKVTADAANNGFRYGWALEAARFVQYKLGARAGSGSRFRYASGPRKAMLTRHWFSGALRVKRAQINRILEGAAREIERTWQKAA